MEILAVKKKILQVKEEIAFLLSPHPYFPSRERKKYHDRRAQTRKKKKKHTEALLFDFVHVTFML